MGTARKAQEARGRPGRRSRGRAAGELGLRTAKPVGQDAALMMAYGGADARPGLGSRASKGCPRYTDGRRQALLPGRRAKPGQCMRVQGQFGLAGTPGEAGRSRGWGCGCGGSRGCVAQAAEQEAEAAPAPAAEVCCGCCCRCWRCWGGWAAVSRLRATGHELTQGPSWQMGLESTGTRVG